MQDRLNKIQEWVTRLADNESSVMDDINFLLDALGQAQDKIKSLEFDLKNKTHLNATAIHIIEKQKDTMLKITETYTDENGKVWEVPTSWAYAQACKALHKHTDQERVLRESILKFMDEFCSNFRTMDQRATVCYPPDERQCGNYDACRELNKILAQNEKPSTIISVDTPTNTPFANLVKKKFNQVI